MALMLRTQKEFGKTAELLRGFTRQGRRFKPCIAHHLFEGLTYRIQELLPSTDALATSTPECHHLKKIRSPFGLSENRQTAANTEKYFAGRAPVPAN